ncbi:VWA domain-containing protein [Amphritea balenae]|uniref:Mg-protoporphyrin IX chelatase n=2 Tax=Amphritea balenae TaxID=452629 RepID=A0A3P1SU84_9GAMM|nr:VWA domain-containing protein [Amphritea balenae]
MTDQYFPFSAVAGQDQFKLALMLAAVNPAIGGVVISGPRGCAKSTLARGLADLLPPHKADAKRKDDQSLLDAEFVTLPLGASEEMLLGTLDLQQVLNEKKIAFSPGLLSKADGGVLYVDEVNLLPDNLVDLLLDVSASGVNRIERDGISHSHRTEFLLIGTMNPDEGELRPQLHDRFGLSVELTNQYTAAQRVEIVRSREQFDRNADSFCQQYEASQAELIAAIQQARNILHSVDCSDALRLEIAERCNAARVDGLRGDIVWYRAAIAHAALEQRQQVEIVDIEAVEELVLAHRRHATPQPPSSPQPPQPPQNDRGNDRDNGFKRPDDSQRKQQMPQEAPQEQHRSSSDWGSMEPQQQRTAAGVILPLPVSMPEQQPATKLLKGKVEELAGKTKGSVSGGQHKGVTDSHKPDWFGTLLSNMGNWPPAQLRFKKRQQGQSVLHLILLDTSASTLASDQFSNAKAAVIEIARPAYLQREQLAVLGFGNNKVENLLPRIRAPKELRGWLDSLPAGGGTPMGEALQQAQSYLEQLQRKSSQLLIRTYILTDGRSNAQLQGIDLPGETVWIDTEVAAVKRGRGKQFAAQLNAEYISLMTHTAQGVKA